MTLVNTETGEIVDIDRGAAERRAERITLRLDAIADNYRAVLPMIREAIEKRDHYALGYRSPGDYVSDRFGQSLAGLGIEVRRAVVGELTEAGLSTRAIAPVVGISHEAVRKDQRVNQLTPEPSTVATSTPAAVEPAPEGGSFPDVPTSPASDEGQPHAAPARPPVTGIDGKTYKPPAAVAPKPSRSPEQVNAEENSQHLGRSLLFLLAFQHPNMRDHMRAEWQVGRFAVSPTNRGYVTPNHMREAAAGLAALADEWESQ